MTTPLDDEPSGLFKVMRDIADAAFFKTAYMPGPYDDDDDYEVEAVNPTSRRPRDAPLKMATRDFDQALWLAKQMSRWCGEAVLTAPDHEYEQRVVLHRVRRGRVLDEWGQQQR